MLIAIHFDTIYYLKFIITLLNIENYSHFTYSLKKKERKPKFELKPYVSQHHALSLYHM